MADTMKKARRIFFIISVNTMVFVLMLISANLLAALVIDLRLDRLFERDNRALLPNYSDKRRAEIMFDEFNSLPSEYRAYVGWSKKEFRGRATTINGEGDRVHKPTTQNPIGVARFFGGSSMWGTGADDEGTIPAHFNRLFPEYRVHNHAQAGFLSRQSLARLVNLALQNEPLNLVVFYDGVNEVQYYCDSNVSPNSHARADRIAELVGRSRIGTLLYGNLKEVADTLGSRLHAFLKRSTDVASRCEKDSAYARQIARQLIETWKLARSVVSQQGGRFVAVLQPVIYFGSPMRDHLDESLTNRRARSYRAVYPHIQNLIAELDVDWIYDFTDTFDGREFIYLDFCHVSENGNRLIAERLARVLSSGDDIKLSLD